MKTTFAATLVVCLVCVNAFSISKRIRRQAGCQLSLWETNGGFEYAYNDRREDFITAQTACQACSASLASVHSLEENNFIRSLAPPNETLYIGFSDQESEGKFVWLDGTNSVSWTYWRTGSKSAEPDDLDSDGVTTNADCAYITANGVWRDIVCSSLRRSVCKKAIPVTTPPTVVVTTDSQPEIGVPQPTQTEAPQPIQTEAPQTEGPQPIQTEAPQTEAPQPTQTEAPQTTQTTQTTAFAVDPRVDVVTERPDDGYRRTVILMERKTSWGENVFLRGGSAGDGRPVAIRYRDLSSVLSADHTKLYDAWRQGDGSLDWNGPEAQQGKFNGVGAQGTPAVWTTSSKEDPLGRYHPLNTFGEHYWCLDVDMDCTQTNNGTFEVKGYLGAWESGSNHRGKCGAVNVFQWGSSSSATSTLP